jgi:hypothetical protein
VNMKKMVFGTLLCIAGVAIGLYVGVWLMLIGGIVDVITEIRAVELSAMGVALGIAKVMLSSVVGTLSGLFLLAPGAALIKDA